MTKHFIVVNGYPGAGKTTAVKDLLGLSTHHRTWLRSESPFARTSLRGVPANHEVGSLWSLDGIDFIAAGCHRKDEPNKQGADIFVSLPKYEVIEWLAEQPSQFLLWDAFNVGPRMLRWLRERFFVHFVFIDVAMEEAMARRDRRRDGGHHSAKDAKDLLHFYQQVDRNLLAADDLVPVYLTKEPVQTIRSIFRTGQEPEED